MKLFIFLFSLFFLSQTIVAQTVDTRWGKISDEEWTLESCPYDTAAQAIILLDKARIYFIGGQAVIERHRRIKILDQKALTYADIKIPYVRYDDREDIEAVRAQTFNRSNNGKPVEMELSGNQIFIDKIDDYWGSVNIAFPAVQKGSIIEYKYNFYTKSIYFLEPWFFQNELPTAHSELSFEVPPYLNYTILKIGERIKQLADSKTENRWILKNLPGFKNEQYVFHPEDYADQLRFQLLNYQTLNTKSTAGGVETVEVLKDWNALGKEILEDCNGFLNRDKIIQNIISNLVTAEDAPKEKLRKIFNHVQDNYSWNEFWSIYPRRSFNEFESSHKGSTSEMNLFLTALLREAEWEADPVLVSTRSHGKVIQSFPLLSQFNNLICRAIADTDTFFLDATARQHKYPYFLLSKENLNFYGFLIKKDHYSWINITPWKDSRSNASLKIDLANLTGEWKLRLEGYPAMEERSRWRHQKDKYVTFTKVPELSEVPLLLGVPSIEAATELENPFLISYQFPVEKPEANVYYISLSDWTRFSEVPFKMPTRIFPVEMDYPFTDNLVATITIPPNYVIESLPKDLTLQLKTNQEAGRFTFSTKTLENKIIITSRFILKDVIFVSDFYQPLKSFYEQIHSKFNEVIVLKKQ